MDSDLAQMSKEQLIEEVKKLHLIPPRARDGL